MTVATLTRIRESVMSGDNLRVNREAGLIKGVKILGRESMNGRTYSENALREASKFYEGIKVNIDHPDRSNPNQERSFTSFAGQLVHCHVAESGDVYGDLDVLKSGSHAESIFEAAERFPKQFGLSHNAEGELVQKDGGWVVESIDCVHSVDIVSQPATNAGLFESVGRGRYGRKTRRQIIVEGKEMLLRTGRIPRGVTRLLEQMVRNGLDPNEELSSSEEEAVAMSDDDLNDSLDLSLVPDTLQQVKMTAIKMLAKKSTSGKRTAKDIQAVNDYIDNGIQMLERMFPEELGNQRKPEDATLPKPPGSGFNSDSLAPIPESVNDFVNSLRGKNWKPSADAKEFASRIHKPPVITRSESRRERIRESRLVESEDTNWKPSADAKEFASRLRKA